MAGGKEPGATKVSIEQVLGALASKRGERAVPPSPDRVGGAAGEHRTAQLRALRQPIEMSRLETERIGLRRPNGREHERGGARRVVAPTIRHPQPDAPHLDAVIFPVGPPRGVNVTPETSTPLSPSCAQRPPPRSRGNTAPVSSHGAPIT